MANLAPDVAIILVNWNGADDTLSCIEALLHLDKKRPYVVVIDNGSVDDSAERLKECPAIDLLILSPINLGFGAGCNMAVAHLKDIQPTYIWLLNNDARPAPPALQAMVQTMESSPKIGAVGSVIYRDDDFSTIDCWGGGKINFITGKPRHLLKPDSPDYITGASLLMRFDLFQSVGGFDEKYFLYWEDADLCFRLRRAGWLLAVAPNSHVRHAVSASAKKSGRNIIRYFNDSAIRFHRTYAPLPLAPLILNFSYRFLGQLKAGEFRNAWTLLRITLRFDRVKIPKKPANIKIFIRER